MSQIEQVDLRPNNSFLVSMNGSNELLVSVRLDTDGKHLFVEGPNNGNRGRVSFSLDGVSGGPIGLDELFRLAGKLPTRDRESTTANMALGITVAAEMLAESCDGKRAVSSRAEISNVATAAIIDIVRLAKALGLTPQDLRESISVSPAETQIVKPSHDDLL